MSDNNVFNTSTVNSATAGIIQGSTGSEETIKNVTVKYSSDSDLRIKKQTRSVVRREANLQGVISADCLFQPLSSDRKNILEKTLDFLKPKLNLTKTPVNASRVIIDSSSVDSGTVKGINAFDSIPVDTSISAVTSAAVGILNAVSTVSVVIDAIGTTTSGNIAGDTSALLIDTNVGITVPHCTHTTPTHSILYSTSTTCAHSVSQITPATCTHSVSHSGSPTHITSVTQNVSHTVPSVLVLPTISTSSSISAVSSVSVLPRVSDSILVSSVDTVFQASVVSLTQTIPSLTTALQVFSASITSSAPITPLTVSSIVSSVPTTVSDRVPSTSVTLQTVSSVLTTQNTGVVEQLPVVSVALSTTSVPSVSSLYTVLSAPADLFSTSSATGVLSSAPSVCPTSRRSVVHSVYSAQHIVQQYLVHQYIA